MTYRFIKDERVFWHRGADAGTREAKGKVAFGRVVEDFESESPAALVLVCDEGTGMRRYLAAVHLRTQRRWSVCIGGYPNGWEAPVLETDDPEVAIARFEEVHTRLRGGGYRYLTVAIFDDNGEGEPLDPDRVREKLADSGI